MSMHTNPLTYMEKRGLHAHGLPTDEPSQLSDAFRAGVAWAGHEVQSLKNELEAKVRQNAQLMRERDAYRNAEETQIALRERVQEERDALAAQIERLDNELQDKALTDDGVLADAYWNCADMITPWLGEKTGPDTLINSVCGSLEFLIEQWREKKTLEQERERRDLIKQADMVELVVRRLGGDMRDDVVTNLNDWAAQLKLEAQEPSK